MIDKEIVAGDTFPIVYTHKQNGVVADMPEAYDCVIGLRNENGGSIITFSYQNNDIERVAEGTYRWKLPFELSKSLSGTVIIEIVVFSADLSYVQHSLESVRLKVIPSYMNDIIANDLQQ